MTPKLAFLEGAFLFATVCGAILLWTPLPPMGSTDVALVLSKAFALSLSCLVSFYYNDLYDVRIVRSFGDFASRLLQAVGIAFILLAAVYALFPQTKIDNGPFFSSILITLALLLSLRAISYRIVRGRRFLERVLMLGTSTLAHKLIQEIDARPDLGYVVVGLVDDASASEPPHPTLPLLGPLARIDKIIADVQPRRIIVALSERRARLPVHQLLEARLSGVIVEDGVSAYEALTGKLAIESLTPSNLIFSRDFRKSRFNMTVGRSVSLLVSLAGIVALAPLLGLIALLIKLDSRGPVLFVQERVGMYGNRFKLVKFRTMYPVNRRTSEWVRDNSDRITRVGKWLRTFRLDELPQFLNVLRGEMNLVGPRPHPVSNFQLFMEKIPYYSLRSMVRPGVTGWAQVRLGYANNLEEETEKMRYDLYYMKHLSFWFDLRILFDTIKIVLFGRGSKSADAYRAGVAMSVGGR